MNNKGFSLVELLAVIALLAVLLLIFTPNITKMIDDFRNKKQTEILKNSAISAAKEYVVDGKADTSNIDCGSTPIKNNFNIKVIDSLIEDKYLESNDWYTNSHEIKVTYDCNNKKFTNYEFIE